MFALPGLLYNNYYTVSGYVFHFYCDYRIYNWGSRRDPIALAL